jgi:hypothetical protein
VERHNRASRVTQLDAGRIANLTVEDESSSKPPRVDVRHPTTEQSEREKGGRTMSTVICPKCGVINSDALKNCRMCVASLESAAPHLAYVPTAEGNTVESARVPLASTATFGEWVKTRVGSVVVGCVLGGLFGYLLRPSYPLIGQLPFGIVISRGATLRGFDQALVPLAQTSFNYLLFGAVVGAALSYVIFKLAPSSTPLEPAEIDFLTAKPIQDAKTQILGFFVRQGGAIKMDSPQLVTASFGSTLTTRLLGSWFAGVESLPREVLVMLSEKEGKTGVKVVVRDAFGFGSRVGMETKLRGIMQQQAVAIKAQFDDAK